MRRGCWALYSFRQRQKPLLHHILRTTITLLVLLPSTPNLGSIVELTVSELPEDDENGGCYTFPNFKSICYSSFVRTVSRSMMFQNGNIDMHCIKEAFLLGNRKLQNMYHWKHSTIELFGPANCPVAIHGSQGANSFPLLVAAVRCGLYEERPIYSHSMESAFSVVLVIVFFIRIVIDKLPTSTFFLLSSQSFLPVANTSPTKS